MTANLRRQRAYLTLLLTTPSKTQATALVDTATKDQAGALSEIAYNLLRLPLAPGLKQSIGKRKSILKKISDPKLTPRKRLSLLSKHQRVIIQVLRMVKSRLLPMLK